MNDSVNDIVIVGGGLAAAKAAETVRADGFAGPLRVVAEEAERPYERPPLSKGFLSGTQPLAEVYVHPPDYYAAHDIELLLGDPVTRIDRGAGEVVTRAGRRLPFDRLLLATGAAPRLLPFGAGDDLMTLRTLDDSRRLAERLRAVGHVTIVGAGWIGCEVAAAARGYGAQVTMIDPLEVPLARVLGVRVGALFRDLHAAHGVDLRLGTGVSGFRGGDAVEQVVLGDDSVVDTDLVVVGVGAGPRSELAEACGLQVDDGVVVDETLTSSDPRILAAGDVARAWHPFFARHLRVEHWANALNQGQTAGHNLLGKGAVYERLPYFYSDQYDLGMEYSGFAEAGDEVVLRGSLDTRELIAFWLRDDRVVAGMNVNVWDVVDDVQALIASRRPVDRRRLADPGVPLRDVAG